MTLGILVRPFRLPEAVWAVAGAAAVVALGLLPAHDALHAIGKGSDVYLFLAGMMLLSETARRAGLFDWVAAWAVNRANGSRRKLFMLVYGVGIVVTAFLSNDAAAVVLTPAVFAASKKAKVPALPYLFICAFIANAASFVLPISNPANLVLYGDRMPTLGAWLASFGLPSVVAIVVTYGALRFSQRRELVGSCASHVETASLGASGWTALAGLVSTAVALLVVSALGYPLGAPTCALGVLTAGVVLWRDRAHPWSLLGKISWAVLPLVAGLFVLVEALNRGGAVHALAAVLSAWVNQSATGAALAAGVLLAFFSNVFNNLPAGLIVADTLALARPPRVVVDALLVGVDLGPNLSITGSLATILWLTALRREGLDVGFRGFLKVGLVVMPPALLLTVGVVLATG